MYKEYTHQDIVERLENSKFIETHTNIFTFSNESAERLVEDGYNHMIGCAARNVSFFRNDNEPSETAKARDIARKESKELNLTPMRLESLFLDDETLKECADAIRNEVAKLKDEQGIDDWDDMILPSDNKVSMEVKDIIREHMLDFVGEHSEIDKAKTPFDYYCNFSDDRTFPHSANILQHEDNVNILNLLSDEELYYAAIGYRQRYDGEIYSFVCNCYDGEAGAFDRHYERIAGELIRSVDRDKTIDKQSVDKQINAFYQAHKDYEINEEVKDLGSIIEGGGYKYSGINSYGNRVAYWDDDVYGWESKYPSITVGKGKDEMDISWRLRERCAEYITEYLTGKSDIDSWAVVSALHDHTDEIFGTAAICMNPIHSDAYEKGEIQKAFLSRAEEALDFYQDMAEPYYQKLKNGENPQLYPDQSYSAHCAERAENVSALIQAIKDNMREQEKTAQQEKGKTAETPITNKSNKGVFTMAEKNLAYINKKTEELANSNPNVRAIADAVLDKANETMAMLSEKGIAPESKSDQKTWTGVELTKPDKMVVNVEPATKFNKETKEAEPLLHQNGTPVMKATASITHNGQKLTLTAKEDVSDGAHFTNASVSKFTKTGGQTHSVFVPQDKIADSPEVNKDLKTVFAAVKEEGLLEEKQPNTYEKGAAMKNLAVELNKSFNANGDKVQNDKGELVNNAWAKAEVNDYGAKVVIRNHDDNVMVELGTTSKGEPYAMATNFDINSEGYPREEGQSPAKQFLNNADDIKACISAPEIQAAVADYKGIEMDKVKEKANVDRD